MCSIERDIEEISICSDEIRKTGRVFDLGICRKCGEKSVLLLQKKDPLCKNCFLEYCNHKFRSTLGKSKKIRHNDTVLIAFSGGLKSTAMLHLVKEMLQSASHKRLVIVPIICYINETVTMSLDSNFDLPEEVFENLNCFKFPVLQSCIEMALREDDSKDFFWKACDPKLLCNQNCSPMLRQKFFNIFNNIKTLSAKLDFLKHSRLQLLVDIAKMTGCNHIFLGDSATDLAIQLLSDVALGRGSQISANSSFFDDRHEVSLCRPMREFLNKEIALLNHMQNYSYTVLPDLLTKTDSQSSIQRLTETFVCNLQENFPATIFTIFRTGGKLSSIKSSSEGDSCTFCKSKLDNVNPDKCSALNAYSISHNLSTISADSASSVDLSINNDFSDSKDVKRDDRQIGKLCHACSVTFEEIGNKNQQSSVLFELVQQINRQKMKEEIQSFLLEEE